MTRPITLIWRPGLTALIARRSASSVRSTSSRHLLVDVAGEERRVGVAVHAVEVRGDVDVDDVAVLDHAAVRDAVADHLVDAGAQRLREAAVAERRGVGAVVAEELVADPVELVGGDARARRAGRPSCSACAASRPATRIRSIVSASLTSGPSNGAGAGRSTYSGRGMCAGTGRRGETMAGATAVTRRV